MKHYLVTGCAGFIGSTLTDSLLARGEKVTGIDAFRDYYDPELKRKNISKAIQSEKFTLIEGDLSRDVTQLTGIFEPEEDLVVYHLAAQAGVRKSWGTDFSIYTRDNVDSTQRLLEWSKSMKNLKNFIYASSSSVYGIPAQLPMVEDRTVPLPHSPYGVTKLAGENLVRLYTANLGLPSVSLRFFTVYGPRQRPDMAFHRFIKAGIQGNPLGVFGTGEQTRDFTYIDDVVKGLILAENCTDGSTMNLGGGNRVTLNEAIAVISKVMGIQFTVSYSQSKKGDVPDTWASTDLARKKLNWHPFTSLEQGLLNEFSWINTL